MKRLLTILIIAAVSLLALASCEVSHTYGEGVEYRIPGSSERVIGYTCQYCGATKLSDFIGDMKSYNITIEDIDGCIIDKPTKGVSGTIYRIRTHKIIDADLRFVVNGTEIYPRETDDDRWVYEFVMPCEDIHITAEIVGGGPELEAPLLRHLSGCEWLNEIDAPDIAEIKIINEYVGVAPGNLKNIESSSREDVIARLFEEYYWLETRPIPSQNGMIAGGSAVTVRFILKDGSEKELYFNNGNYRDTDGNYFRLFEIPGFRESDYAANALGFISYGVVGELLDGNNAPICEIPVSELEFVSADYDPGLFADGYDYYINTAFGKLCFAKTEIFASEGDVTELVGYIYYFVKEGGGDACFMLVGKGIDELIAEYGTDN